jgi:hypothetical protein
MCNQMSNPPLMFFKKCSLKLYQNYHFLNLALPINYSILARLLYYYFFDLALPVNYCIIARPSTLISSSARTTSKLVYYSSPFYINTFLSSPYQ